MVVNRGSRISGERSVEYVDGVGEFAAPDIGDELDPHVRLAEQRV